MDDKVIFKDKNSMMSVELLYTVGGYTTYEISVSSFSFSGCCNFCISTEEQKRYIEKIGEMIDKLDGCVEIKDCESDSYMRIFFLDNKFYVSGQIGESWGDNMLKFKLKADQTLLYGLKQNLI